MPQTLTEQDQRQLVQWAGMIHQMKADADRERERLEAADEVTLRAVLSDRAASQAARGTALMLLLSRNRHRRDGSLEEVLLPLWDDPDKHLARMAIEQTPPSDPELTRRLHALLDDPEGLRWSTAASVLARGKDTTIVPQLRAWFHEGDQAHRNVAYACLCFYQLLEPDERHALLRQAWDAGGRDDDDRAMLAVGLLDLGDRVGWPFLIDLARRADTYSATWAADTIHAREPALGYELMLHILDHGASFQVRWGMAERIAQSAAKSSRFRTANGLAQGGTRAVTPEDGGALLHHLWTADGLAEVRYWVEQQRELLRQS
jgi:hypothetical protein